MKDLWRWLKMEWEYISYPKALHNLALLALWVCVGRALWNFDLGAVLSFSVLIIAWKLKSKHDE